MAASHDCRADCSSASSAAELSPPRVGYIELMFEVLVFVYENYWRGDACPQLDQLQRKLSAVGFEAEEIQDALAWLGGLSLATRNTQLTTNSKSSVPFAGMPLTSAGVDQSSASMRVYS